MTHTIFGVHITDRVKNVPAVQAILTKYGCNIRVRLGLHDVDENKCSPCGLVLLDVIGAESEDLFNELKGVEGVNVQRMDFPD
ncbi:MAG: hypothetical protein N3B14_04950 [Thermoleophilia bacterium]|nr:hypothetical protein [Thermoleophilia bacterium]